jgi:exodeoxyribonuclease-3
MRIATWNVNSIRARQARLLSWLEAQKPDVVCLQELKCTDADFPADALREVGYHAAWNGQKTYNGVAILARTPPEDVVKGLSDGVEDTHARLIAATVQGVRVVSAYAPNGQEVDSPACTRTCSSSAGGTTACSPSRRTAACASTTST